MGDQGSGRTGGKEGKTDWLAVGVCTVEFANGLAGIGDVAVGDVGCAGGAAGTIVPEGEGLSGCDTVEEVLSGREILGCGEVIVKGESEYCNIWDGNLLEGTYVQVIFRELVM